MDINEYANDLLLIFLDEFHERLRVELKEAFGSEWLELGIRKHFKAEEFVRVEQMINSPMAVVDMGKSPEDIYGVEHLPNIIVGNWELFESRFVNRQRSQVYLGEITEMRNNLSHRRKKHLVRHEDLIRFAQNARMLLGAIGSKAETQFDDIVGSLSQGQTPWAAGLIEVRLPPHDEIYDEFLGRSGELRQLFDWFTSDSEQFMVWGYGGVGKSALAHRFARELLEVAPNELDAILWLTAKKTEFGEGITRERIPDFVDARTFCAGVFNALYGDDLDSVSETELITELKETRCLLIVDDFDTVINDQEAANLLLFKLRGIGSKVLFTSRLRAPGLAYMDVPPFDDDMLRNFLIMRSKEYGANESDCLKSMNGIRSVTDGYPLFVDDFVRYSALVGINNAIAEWRQRKGDPARAYALKRQLLDLGGVSEDTLMSIAVADKPLSIVEISHVSQLTDEDAESGVTALLGRRLIHRAAPEEGSDPAFSINANTRRLTRSTFRHDPKLRLKESAYKALTGERKPESRRRAIGSAIAQSTRVLNNQGVEAAANFLVGEMIGELRDDPDLQGKLGWIYSRDWRTYGKSADESFQRAHELGTRNVTTYFHWTELLRNFAEEAVGKEADKTVLDLWRKAFEVAHLAIVRCGDSDGRCTLGGYMKSREAKTLNRLNEFSQARAALFTAVGLFERALKAPREERVVYRSQIYRGLVLAYDELGELQGLTDTLRDWHTASSTDPNLITEASKLGLRRPVLFNTLSWLATLPQSRTYT